jgi:hypothetical protein
MKKIFFFILLLAPLFMLNSCEDEVLGTKDLNYITFEATARNVGVAIGGTTDHEFKVYTTQITGTDRTFPVNVVAAATTADAAAYTVPATVTVPANTNVGTLKITLKDVNIGTAGKKLALELGAQEGLFKGGILTLTINQICTQNDVSLNILFDGYASETTWELKNSSGAVIATGGGYADGLASTSAKWCLPNGTYTFTINDAYGDGLSYPNNGNATITKGTTVLVSIVGDFGATATATFSVTK